MLTLEAEVEKTCKSGNKQLELLTEPKPSACVGKYNEQKKRKIH